MNVSGTCVVLAGSPCAGKTTLAALIAAELTATLIDKDTIEWPLCNAALAAGGLADYAHESELYKTVLKHAAYETMERIAEQNTKLGGSVVLVAPFSSHVKDKTWQPALQARLGVDRVSVLWVTASHDVLLARKSARGEGRDLVDGPAGDPALFAASEAARSPPVGPHMLLDTTAVAGNITTSPPNMISRNISDILLGFSAVDMPAVASQALRDLLASPAAPDESTAASSSGESEGVPRGVVCAGHACIDVIMEQCDELTHRESFAAAERFSLVPGGAVSNTAMQLARLGVVSKNDEFCIQKRGIVYQK